MEYDQLYVLSKERCTMPLNGEQMRTIEDSISHLLDFSLDPNIFATEEAELVNALLTPIDNMIGKTNPFYWLRECLLKPSLHFQNLLKQGPQVSLGDVQQYIIDLIDTSLLKTSHPLQAWKKDVVLATLPKQHWNIHFEPEKALVDGGDNPWQLPVLTDQIYTQSLRIEEHTDFIETEHLPLTIISRILYVDVNINLLTVETEQQSIQVKKIKDYFRNDAEENQYMEKLKIDAQYEARKAAAYIALKSLAFIHTISYKTMRKIIQSEATKTLITNKFYFQLLLQGTLTISAIVNLTQLEVDHLCHPSMIWLIKKNHVTIDDIRGLSRAESRVITHPIYLDLLDKKLLTLQQIKNINHDCSKLITHPRITNLIQRRKLSFLQALTIPLYLKDILLSDLYVTFFINNEVDWDVFIKIKQEHHLILLNKSIACFINNGVLNWNTIVNITEECKDAEAALLHCFINTFAIRLYWMAKKTPYLLNDTQDTLQILLNEITHTVQDLKYELNAFKEWIICQFLNFIKFDIEKRLDEVKKQNFETVVYENILHIITPKVPMNLSHVLSILIHQCRLTLRVHRFLNHFLEDNFHINNSLFSRVNKDNQERPAKRIKISDTGDALNFCACMLILTPLDDNKILNNSSISMRNVF